MECGHNIDNDEFDVMTWTVGEFLEKIRFCSMISPEKVEAIDDILGFVQSELEIKRAEEVDTHPQRCGICGVVFENVEKLYAHKASENHYSKFELAWDRKLLELATGSNPIACLISPHKDVNLLNGGTIKFHRIVMPEGVNG